MTQQQSANADSTPWDTELPCADYKLLVPLKRSPEYRAIRRRLAGPKPIDTWQQNGLHLFVFQLRLGALELDGENPVVVFAMRPDSPQSVSVVLSSPDGAHAQILHLRAEGQIDTAPLAADGEGAAEAIVELGDE